MVAQLALESVFGFNGIELNAAMHCIAGRLGLITTRTWALCGGFVFGDACFVRTSYDPQRSGPMDYHWGSKCPLSRTDPLLINSMQGF